MDYSNWNTLTIRNAFKLGQQWAYSLKCWLRKVLANRL